MKHNKSEIYGKVVAPASFAELVEAIRIPHPKEHFNVRMWRGQANIEWPIHSAAYRRMAIDRNPVRELDVAHLEEGLMKRASHKGYDFVEGRKLSDLELLARLQHHGAATRLVDASRSAFVALWFAVESHPKSTGLLVGLHSSFLGGYEGELEDRPYEELMSSVAELDYPATWEPPVVTQRIAAQHSQFLFSRIADAATGSLALPKEEGSTLFIAISPEMKVEAKTVLTQTFDIHEATLFPDLDGFGHSNRHSISRQENYRW